jgi:hypothetical protein
MRKIKLHKFFHGLRKKLEMAPQNCPVASWFFKLKRVRAVPLKSAVSRKIFFALRYICICTSGSWDCSPGLGSKYRTDMERYAVSGCSVISFYSTGEGGRMGSKRCQTER